MSKWFPLLLLTCAREKISARTACKISVSDMIVSIGYVYERSNTTGTHIRSGRQCLVRCWHAFAVKPFSELSQFTADQCNKLVWIKGNIWLVNTMRPTAKAGTTINERFLLTGLSLPGIPYTLLSHLSPLTRLISRRGWHLHIFIALMYGWSYSRLNMTGRFSDYTQIGKEIQKRKNFCLGPVSTENQTDQVDLHGHGHLTAFNYGALLHYVGHRRLGHLYDSDSLTKQQGWPTIEVTRRREPHLHMNSSPIHSKLSYTSQSQWETIFMFM